MSVIANPYDFVRFRRIINEPKRSIGEATQAEIERVSIETGMSPIDVMARSAQMPTLYKKSRILESIARIFEELSTDFEDRDLSALIDDIVEQTGYKKMLESEGDEGATRLENIRELKSAAVKFQEEHESTGLLDFLEQIALASDTDSLEPSEDKVILMTMHAAKGLEFGTVFLIGAEEGIFPSYSSLADPMEVEEERRLAYVAITRAKRILNITTAKQRLIYGMTQYNKTSRFAREIPDEYINLNEKKRKPAQVKAERPKKEGYLTRAAIDKANSQTVSSVPQPDFKQGERIKHKVFGDGMVVNVQPMGNDALLEIAFDTVGTKKVMANFAKMEKL
jgi:DNA helicase-2/ATP-dependent DNA helicase PcrA